MELDSTGDGVFRKKLSCSKCGKEYKLRSALEKHQPRCVKVAKRGALRQIVAESADGDLIKLAVDLPELVVKKVRRKSKPKKVAQVQDNENINGTVSRKGNKSKPKSLLEQADQETKWQLIQCNINEVLTEPVSSQSQPYHITQQMPASKLSRTTSSGCRWWAAARDAPALKNSRESRPSMDENAAISTNMDIEANEDLLPAADKTRSTTSTYEAEGRGALMTKLKDKLCPGPDVVDLLAEPSGSNDQPVKTSCNNGSALVNCPLFSDISITTKDNVSISAHKALLATAYPEMNTFLEFHKEINLPGLSAEDLTIWLTAVYTRNFSLVRDQLSTDVMALISKFLDFSSSWKQSDSSNHVLVNHTRTNIDASKKLFRSKVATKQKKRKSHSNSVFAKKIIKTSPCHAALSPTASQIVRDSPSAMVTKVPSPNKPKGVKHKLKVRKRSLPMQPSIIKVSRLLSTVGALSSLGSETAAPDQPIEFLLDSPVAKNGAIQSLFTESEHENRPSSQEVIAHLESHPVSPVNPQHQFFSDGAIMVGPTLHSSSPPITTPLHQSTHRASPANGCSSEDLFPENFSDEPKTV